MNEYVYVILLKVLFRYLTTHTIRSEKIITLYTVEKSKM